MMFVFKTILIELPASILFLVTIVNLAHERRIDNGMVITRMKHIRRRLFRNAINL